eukprot:CAMPEP_0177633940 /NCGR_PEP_ID=MMETSP0447-20121125/3107_1 /TAXON_ID=0 /ORGANISM="Stygamoeba regulata, Strain BSH-02190019" /LENGTH=282 /DNA_ID=CAMNT_0019135637 /DNA_START=164 /DNA_END=1010 /DNA_ORIENTATION=-
MLTTGRAYVTGHVDCEGQALNSAGPQQPHAQAKQSGVTFVQLHQLVHDFHDYKLMNRRKNLLLLYIFLVLLYVGLNVALLGVNFESQEFIEENYYTAFHMAAFWGVFAFTLLEAFILISTETVHWWVGADISWLHRVQSLVILFNVMFSFATAVLFSMFPEEFEVPAHYMEYSVQVLITAVNLFFVVDQTRDANPNGLIYRLRYVEFTVALLVLALSVLQILIFSGAIPTTIEAERAAHFCEFTNEIFNGLFALMYAILAYTNVRKTIVHHYKEMKAAGEES